MSIILLGWGFASIGFLLAICKESIWQYRVSRGLLTIILVFLVLLATPANKDFLFAKSKPLGMRSEIEQTLPVIEKKVPLDASIYYIWQEDHSHGKRHWIFAYLMCPRKASPGMAWSFGKPYYEGDRWTRDITSEQMRDIFKGYDYIYIGHADEKFWKRYGTLFSDVNFMEYFSGAAAENNYLGNLMRDNTVMTIEQGPIAWSGWSVTKANDGVADPGRDNSYGYTGSSGEAKNNGRGLTLTFNRSVALTTLVHWAYNLTFNYVIEYYSDGEWMPIGKIACPSETPAIISFNEDRSKSSTKWRWYISDWNNPGTNFYSYELEAYESMPEAYSEYINFMKHGALFRIIKSPNENISIKKIALY